MREPRSQSEPISTRALLPILTVDFIGSLGFSIVLPFLVFLVTRWGGKALIYGIVGATCCPSSQGVILANESHSAYPPFHDFS